MKSLVTNQDYRVKHTDISEQNRADRNGSFSFNGNQWSWLEKTNNPVLKELWARRADVTNSDFNVSPPTESLLPTEPNNSLVIPAENTQVSGADRVETIEVGSGGEAINLFSGNNDNTGTATPDGSNPTEPIGSENNSNEPSTVVSLSNGVDPLIGVTDSKIQAGKEYKGEGTFYGATGAGHCSYDPVKPGEPLLIAAMNHEQYNNAEACGSYVEVSGPKQEEGAEPIVVKIVDECPECKPGDLDLSPQAFEMIGNPNDGRIPISWHLVNPEKTDPIVYHSKEGSTNEYWTAIQIRNSNAPISKLEMLEDNGSWTELQLEPYNYFVDSNGIGAGEHTFRLTNTLGQIITETFEPAIGGQDIVSQYQFPSTPFPTPS